LQLPVVLGCKPANFKPKISFWKGKRVEISDVTAEDESLLMINTREGLGYSHESDLKVP
jgi:hypothetical protein